MREGEIFCLKWDDINRESCEITIDENRAISEFGYMDVDPKSVRGNRTIVVPQKIIDLLEERRKSQSSISPYVFTMRPDSYSDRFGKIIDRHNKALKDVKAKRAKKSDFIPKGYKRSIEFNLQDNPLPDIRFHDLRHYHATFLHNHGISDQYAADRLGHDIMVLKKIYQHLDQGAKKAADAKVKDLFK